MPLPKETAIWQNWYRIIGAARESIRGWHEGKLSISALSAVYYKYMRTARRHFATGVVIIGVNMCVSFHMKVISSGVII